MARAGHRCNQCRRDSVRSAAFTQEDVELLTLFASQSAILVESGRLLHAERKAEGSSRNTARSNQRIEFLSGPGEVLKLILDQLARVVQYDSASVMLIAGKKLEIVASRGFNIEDRRSLAIGSLKHLQEVIRYRAPGNHPRYIPGPALDRASPKIHHPQLVGYPTDLPGPGDRGPQPG
jgi:hypothetical protein